MAEGRAEEAIQPGRRALELNPTSAHAYTAWARSHLLAACAQGCAARESLRNEKKKEKAAGRAKTQLEAREEEQRTQMERREMAKGDRKPSGKPPMDRGQLRAGAMWRIMEAGRLWKQGAATEPESEEVQRLHRMSKRLITLDAFKVLNTEQVIQFGQCEHFFGQELDGHMCDKKRYKYE